ncbi:autotransporter outer membrane beta-barrel domain-containing protein [Ereboglobus luteus]|nr:autotransporter outer membrane beta-barrel domain-containing protein [Ereboglobus luteus]
MSYLTNVGGVAGTYGDYFGENLINLIQQPGVSTGGNLLPAVVLSSAGDLFTNSGLSDVTLHIADTADGIDITGDMFIANRIVTLTIDGDATISGRIVGNAGSYGSSAGTLIKNGAGTLTLTGTRNWFYGSSKNYNQINAGRVILKSPHALGSGATTIDPDAYLEFSGVSGTMRQAFVGGGHIEVTHGSDLTFNWRNGTLDDFDGMSGNGSWHPAMNEIGTLAISGQSRFSAIASGTYSSVLGGASVYVTVTEGSSLVIGREGLSARGSGATKIPMTYAILANRIDLSDHSTLVLKPNAYLSTGALIVTDTTCAIAFTASGVSRLRWQEGIDPDTITLVSTGSNSARYIVPHGMELIVNDIPVPVSPNESLPNDNSSSGWCREFVLVNQGANPLKDIAMTLTAIDAIHDTVSSRLADELIDPVTFHVPAKGRKWVNAAWVRYLTSDLDYDNESSTTPGVEGNIKGVIAGLDGMLPGRVMLGFHAGIAENELDTTNDTSLSSKQKFLGLHAAQRFGKFYLSFSADIGRVTTDSFRHEDDNYVRGKWDTSYYSGSIQFGGVFESWAKIKLKPYVGLRYSKIKITNHYERGASPLVIDNFNDTSSQVFYGVALGRKFVIFNRDLAIDLSLARKHTVTAPRATLDTHYFDSPNTPVTLKRGDYYDDPIAIGVSARAALSPHTVVGFAFDYETASNHDRTTLSALVAYTW